MIQRQSHSTIYVIDQDEALRFYRDILGFEVNTDMPMDDSGLRWLTLNPKGQPDLELILAQVATGPMFDAETAEEMRAMVERGAFGIGVRRTISRQCASSLMSPAIVRARRPASVTRRSVSRASSSSFRYEMTTSAPSRAYAMATARPMPS